MKTINDLLALIPQLTDLVANNDHEIGYGEKDWDGDSYCWSYNYESNSVVYDEDGWFIEISYSCTGDYYSYPATYEEPGDSGYTKAWGDVDEITASYYDEATGEEIEFPDEVLTPIYKAIENVLADIA